MTDITPSRQNVQVEETDFRSAVSEAVFQKTGGSINFINSFQLDYHAFNMNGAYVSGAGQTGLEGFFPVFYDAEIVGISVNNTVPGVSGTTLVDIHEITAGGTDNGSIFSTKPSADSTAGANAYGIRLFLPSVVDLQTATGIVLPSLSTTNLTAGTCLRFDCDTSMPGAENFSIVIGYRPR